MRVYLSRWVCLDVESNIRRLHEEAAEASRLGAGLCVFPEIFLHGYAQGADAARVRDDFASASAAHPGTAFVFGSFTEQRRNRMTIWQVGRQLAFYDKVHLFDPNRERQIWDPGDRYVAVRAAGWTWGLINCNDIRFPEQARALRLRARCEALVVVGWWPWRRDQIWETLMRARAYENGVFVLGCCVAASEYQGERFAGAGNHVFDPLGKPVQTSDDHIYELDKAALASVLVDPLETSTPVDLVEILPRDVAPSS